MAILVLSECIAIPCIFYEITGLYCPGCGMTRAVKALVRLDVYSSFRNNILLYTVFPIIFILEIMNLKFKNNKKSKKIYNTVMIIILIITIIFAILRNIPAFSFLAPID